MSGNPWVKFYSSDWLGGTSGLTAAERGIYITIIALIYEHDGPIVRDEARLARRCGCPKYSFTRGLESLIEQGKIDLVEGKLTNKKCEAELAERRERSEAGRAAAERKWAKKHASVKSLFVHSPEEKNQQNQGAPDADQYADAYANQNQSLKKEKTTSSPKKGCRLPEDWVLPRHWGEWSLELGMSEDRIRLEADQFRDYWIAATGQRATKRDWLAAWRNWCRRALQDKPETVQPTGGRNGRLARIMDRAASEDHPGRRTPPDDGLARSQGRQPPVPLLPARRR